MDRRVFLQGASAAALASPALAQGPSEDARLRSLLDTFWEETIDESPEAATSLGLDVGARAPQRSQLSNYSSFGRTAMFQRTKGRLGRLRTVDRARLSAASQIDYDVMTYSHERAVIGWSFRRLPNSVGTFAKWARPSKDIVTGPR